MRATATEINMRSRQSAFDLLAPSPWSRFGAAPDEFPTNVDGESAPVKRDDYVSPAHFYSFTNLKHNTREQIERA